MKKIIVLGCGRVGRAICLDLAKKQPITVLDISQENLDRVKGKENIRTTQFDISNTEKLRQILIKFNLVVCSVPGFMGFKTLKTIIEEKKDVVDISFFPEDSLELVNLAQKNNVTAIVDAGVAPGLSNLLLGYYDSLFKALYYACYVGGLPIEKNEPFEYKAPFSPIDVIEEYTRPARLYENSQIVTKEPLTEKELIEFDNIGSLEAFNTDGLRTLLYTMNHIPNMKEKTLRYPGHAEKIDTLKKAGFFNTENVKTKQGSIIPIEFTTEILKKDWLLKEDDLEFTIMRIDIHDKEKKIRIDLFDEYNTKTKTSSMARTTGYTCTACVNMLMENIYNQKGLFPLELIGKNKNCYNYIIKYLEERGVCLKISEKKK
jgi:saccharopine dehydrogenase-like NADP-dependent oxidoreductase